MNERQSALENLVYTLNAIKKKKEIQEAPKKPLIEGIEQLTLIIKESITYKRLTEKNRELIPFSLWSIKSLWYDFRENFLFKELNKYLNNYGIIGGMVMSKDIKYVNIYTFALQSFDKISKLASEGGYGSEKFGMEVHQLRTWLEIIRNHHEELEREVAKA